ncbi:hypothetical protein DTO271D3_626 [Paecilomyces variotii]|nr:hypothetical protein DTO169C6_4693 [Paecilomyces variotii]KAJ9235781.1 hypothetical protein DTO169E5_5944 [Paecilomyces variotii]KAJ9319038.1 hypothetical protein DTO271D3_626 [Paecilomyces variotii]
MKISLGQDNDREIHRRWQEARAELDMNRGSANEILKELLPDTGRFARLGGRGCSLARAARIIYDFRPPTIIIGRFGTPSDTPYSLHQENTDRNWKTIMRERDATDAKLRSYLPQ